MWHANMWYYLTMWSAARPIGSSLQAPLSFFSPSVRRPVSALISMAMALIRGTPFADMMMGGVSIEGNGHDLPSTVIVLVDGLDQLCCIGRILEGFCGILSIGDVPEFADQSVDGIDGHVVLDGVMYYTNL